ncbi:cytochrome P450 [Lactarius quietus]|nr:cytochrome P450 [Lactarius quietus]
MASLMTIIDLFGLISFFVSLSSIRYYRRRRGFLYPPGPRPLPLVGNILDVPTSFSWLTYTELSRKYGDIMSLHIFGTVIIVLNTTKVTKDLLDKRGDIYSDRPVIQIFEMMKLWWLVPFARYADFWRHARKLLDPAFRPGPMKAYRPLIQSKTHTFLTRLLACPGEWEAHIERLQGELVMAITYGYEVKEGHDRKLYAARELSTLASESALPGALLVNELPLLRHIPEWMPWFSYKPIAHLGHNLGQEVVHEPMWFVKESILNGTARSSLALACLRQTEKLRGPEREKAEEVIAGTLGSTYSAGTDSTVSAILSLLITVLLNPDVQLRAQRELDLVTGRERLPTFEDRPRLPFIDAMCKEVLRWQPIAPLSVPHATTQDDIYDGFLIPKCAVVLANTWAILHDPAVYPEPDAFKPERFLDKEGNLRDDSIFSSAFGYGRRVCPGRHLVEMTLFIVTASLFSVFNIERGQDAGGKGDSYLYTGAGLNRPQSFPCSVVPRDKRAEELIVVDAR